MDSCNILSLYLHELVILLSRGALVLSLEGVHVVALGGQIDLV